MTAFSKKQYKNGKAIGSEYSNLALMRQVREINNYLAC